MQRPKYLFEIKFEVLRCLWITFKSLDSARGHNGHPQLEHHYRAQFEQGLFLNVPYPRLDHPFASKQCPAKKYYFVLLSDFSEEIFCHHFPGQYHLDCIVLILNGLVGNCCWQGHWYSGYCKYFGTNPMEKYLQIFVAQFLSHIVRFILMPNEKRDIRMNDTF